MQVYKQTEVQAVLAIFSAFGIKVEVDGGSTDRPMTIRAELYQRQNGEYADEPEETV